MSPSPAPVAAPVASPDLLAGIVPGVATQSLPSQRVPIAGLAIEPATIAANSAPTISRPAIPGSGAPALLAPAVAAGPSAGPTAGPSAGPNAGPNMAPSAGPSAGPVAPSAVPVFQGAIEAPVGAQGGLSAPATSMPRPVIGTLLPAPRRLPVPAPIAVPAVPASPPSVINVTAVGNSTYFSGSPITTISSTGSATSRSAPAGPVQISALPQSSTCNQHGLYHIRICNWGRWPFEHLMPMCFYSTSSSQQYVCGSDMFLIQPSFLTRYTGSYSISFRF